MKVLEARAKLTSSQHFRWHIYFTVYLFHFFLFALFVLMLFIYIKNKTTVPPKLAFKGRNYQLSSQRNLTSRPINVCRLIYTFHMEFKPPNTQV